jgi:inositol phosphorylceramide mannosyltransferase catalytic subunit
MKIPRIFHRIWLGADPMPAEFEAFGKSWEHYHPNWKCRLWSDRNIPPLRNRWVFDQSTSLAARANVLRYEVLLDHGGVYIDTDFECKRNLEPLIREVECFAARQHDGMINNAIIGSTPGHPLIRTIIERLDSEARYTFDEIPSVTQSGPYFFTRIAQNFPGITIFPPELFYPYEWFQRWRKNETYPDAYGVHHWSLSARNSEFPKRRHYYSDRNQQAMSVLIVTCPQDDGLRLKWVLEGLHVQTIVDFEVFVVDMSSSSAVRSIVSDSVRRGLNVELVDKNSWKLRPVFLSNLCNFILPKVNSERLLIIDGDCVPDTDVVETHAKHGSAATAPFGFRRIYSAEKFYNFAHPLDYPGLRINSFQDPRRSSRQLFGDWRDVEGYTLSAPTRGWNLIGGFSEYDDQINFQEAAYQLARCFFRLVPLWGEGYVTQLLSTRHTRQGSSHRNLFVESTSKYSNGTKFRPRPIPPVGEDAQPHNRSRDGQH